LLAYGSTFLFQADPFEQWSLLFLFVARVHMPFSLGRVSPVYKTDRQTAAADPTNTTIGGIIFGFFLQGSQ
jgi:hypothetical protein